MGIKVLIVHSAARFVRQETRACCRPGEEELAGCSTGVDFPTNQIPGGRGVLPLIDQHGAVSASRTVLLGLGVGALLSGERATLPIPRDGTFLGALFESLVTLDVRVFEGVCGAHPVDGVAQARAAAARTR